MLGWLKRKTEIVPAVEHRSILTAGYTSEIMAARAGYLAGMSGTAELTGTVQACVSLWEGAFALADVEGCDMLDRRTMALVARSLALRGESVMLITDMGLMPCSDWSIATRLGIPRAYRLILSEAGGSVAQTALAAEVLHIRIGSDPAAPWTGQSPLRRASLTASLLQEVETALRDVYRDAPLGSQIVPLPEATGGNSWAGAFRGKRGSTLVVEGMAQAVAAGMHPMADKSPDQLSPDLSKAMTAETLEAARASIFAVYGVLPGLFAVAAQGPLVREAQRHLAGWVLQPICELIADEVRAKLGGKVLIDVGRPLQAFDAGGRARALSALIEAMGRAKELGLSPDQLNQALLAVNWGGGDAVM